MIDSPEAYFRLVTNRKNPHFTPDPLLTQLKDRITNSIESKEPFGGELYALPNQDKAKLISALLLNRQETFLTYLREPIKKIVPTAADDTIKKITELADEAELDTGNCLSQPVLAIIDKLLTTKNTSHSIQQTIILQNAMQRIPDTLLSVTAKAYLAAIINPMLAREIENYAYNELPESMQKNKFSGDISEDAYQAILENKKMDSSEYIITTIGALQKKHEKSVGLSAEMQPIRYQYHGLNYADAIKAINAHCHKHGTIIGRFLSNLILQKAREFKDAKPNLNENFTRRFYENRFAQLAKKEINLEQFNKVSQRMTGVIAESMDELESLGMASMKVKKPEYFEIMKKLQKISIRFETRDRIAFGNFISHKKEIMGEACDQVFSRNKGVMTSNQPNLFDETGEENLRNRVVDKNRAHGRKNPDDKSNLSAYAASISGHAFYFIPLLEDYLRRNRNDPMLCDDINNYIKAFAISYASYGYHSYNEIIEVFQEPIVKQLFSFYNITLNIEHSPSIIEQAMRDTQEYTKTLCLKKSVQAEINATQEKILAKHEQIIAKEHAQLQLRIMHLANELEHYQKKIGYFNQKLSAEGKLLNKTLAQLSTLIQLFNTRNTKTNIEQTSLQLSQLTKQLKTESKSIAKDDPKKNKLLTLANDLDGLEAADHALIRYLRSKNTLLYALPKKRYLKKIYEQKETKKTGTSSELFATSGLKKSDSPRSLSIHLKDWSKPRRPTSPIETKTSLAIPITLPAEKPNTESSLTPTPPLGPRPS